ncbi:MAG: selenocysteine-specific translation elongation factor [Hyphomicrobiales bacterium]|nr:selenocysteine-specific translation elongation factor [Hyphomicrobiales bacterium]
MIIGTAGHVDHGKTSLVRALTGVDADRLKEEKERGLTIDLGYAYLPLDNGDTLGFVDVPGHEKFIHNMLAGATSIDFVLLVVAADDGVMPQTLEHIEILDLLGYRDGAVALTKCDLVSESRLAEVKTQIENALALTGFSGAPIFPLSNETGAGVATLSSFLRDKAQGAAASPADGLFRLAVDRVFTIQGRGLVVTGSVLSGVVREGEAIIVSPRSLSARVRAIHAQNKPADEGRAGQRCALNISGERIEKSAILRGDVIVAPQADKPTQRIDAQVRLAPSIPNPLAAWTSAQLHVGAVESSAHIVPLSADKLFGGDDGFVQIVLDHPIAVAKGDPLILRDPARRLTLGGGRVLDAYGPPRRRRTSERLAQLHALTRAPVEALRGLLDVAPHSVAIAAFANNIAYSTDDVIAMAEKLGARLIGRGEETIALERNAGRSLVEAIHAALAAFHADHPDQPGMGIEKLRLLAPLRLPSRAFRALLETLSGEGVVVSGGWVRLASHELRLSGDDEARWAAIKPMLQGDLRFRPPRTRDVARALQIEEAQVRRILKIQASRALLDEIAHDHFFLRGVTSEIVAILKDIAQTAPRSEITAALLRDRLDNGRKVAIQILEFFDRHGVTIRHGDLRRINYNRLDMFAG